MAIHKRSYKPYEGRPTPEWSRFLILSRYSLETLFQSRLLIAFLVACYLFPIFCGLTIYLHHNLSALTVLDESAAGLIPIDNEFFSIFLGVQGVFAFLLTAYAGPGLISPDLSNGALPLYLSRPISRVEYVLGKMAVLFIPLSAITWIPGLILFGIQGGLEGGGWAWNNLRIAAALFMGSWLWIVILSLLALAISAWVRWRLAASALLFGVFFVAAGFSEMINEVLRTKLGYLINLSHLIGTVWAKLFDLTARHSFVRELFNVRRGDEVPLWAAWVMLGCVCAACVLLLNRRLKAREVVK
ncbi:MAG: ABC transporter permease [Bryobacteraceae bacterium]